MTRARSLHLQLISRRDPDASPLVPLQSEQQGSQRRSVPYVLPCLPKCNAMHHLPNRNKQGA